MGMPSMPELIVILVIVLLLFGAKRIPELAKGLGGGIKNFKKALNDDEEKKEEVATTNKAEKIEEATVVKSETTETKTQA